MVVCEGVTTTDVPRTPPAPGETIAYDTPVACHESVTWVPAETDVLLAVNDEMCGEEPVGTLADV